MRYVLNGPLKECRNKRRIDKTRTKMTETTLITRTNRGENQTLVGVIPFCGEHPGPRFEDKFRSANQIDGISIADGGKMSDS